MRKIHNVGRSGRLNPSYKHGLSGTREYRIWCGIKTRCRTPSSTSYPYYGGRGIDICDEWYESFDVFLSHVGMSPSITHSIDRIEATGNYEPGNVRWATKKEQANNRRKSPCTTLIHNGVQKTLNEIAASLGVRYGTILYRVKKGWTIDDICS